MATTKIGTVIDALVALFDAALADVTVYDGSIPSMSFDPDWLIVGGDGQIAEEETAAGTQQRWNGLGARTRDETITVTCAAGASSGATLFKPVRDRALATLAAAEQALRNDPSLGNITQGAAEMSSADLRYYGNERGVAAACLFTVNVPIRLERQ